MVHAIIKTVTNCAALNWFRPLKRFNFAFFNFDFRWPTIVSVVTCQLHCGQCLRWGRVENDIFFKMFSTNIGIESILTQRNSTKKSLFYCYAIFLAKRLLLTNKKQNLSEFNLKVIGYKITLLFWMKVHSVYFKTVPVLSIFSSRHNPK